MKKRVGFLLIFFYPLFIFANPLKCYEFLESKILIDQEKIPKHVAIIMDGNRRWGAVNNTSLYEAYQNGANAISKTIDTALDLGIETLSVFAFSTENWQRSETELSILMYLFESNFLQAKDELFEKGVKIETIGNLEKFPQNIKDYLEILKKSSNKETKLTVVLALSYGGRDEIKRALFNLLEDYDKNNFEKENFTEDLISSYLDTKNFKDPDLLIRTSGEMRLSNFMLWQLSYSELYFTDVLWPDFNELEFLKAIQNYQQRTIRKGK
ncbi:MAG: di-trans,poly-cis-decaprenylcistransferase [Parachlamydiales bacterium]|nr:di-trans,poly-cis-decaprenylcistransferase [Parachlamydiales bacterium]